MNAQTRITFFDDHGEKFFGEGPARLLHAIESEGSLRAAAQSMDMAYTKALKIMQRAEAVLGFPLTTRIAGGRDGGGSRLTPEGKAWLLRYEAYRDTCIVQNKTLYRQSFPEEPAAPLSFGCVIMASGMGRRFGANKLMAPFRGEPLICQALHATQGLPLSCVVVTRHLDVAALCREKAVPVLLHDLPSRSDTVRLGLAALGNLDGCLFLPGDQPLLRRETIQALLCCAQEDPGSIWRPESGGVPGSPVFFPRWAFPALSALPEGMGGSAVIRQYPDRVRTMEITDPRELMDADTPEMLKKLECN